MTRYVSLGLLICMALSVIVAGQTPALKEVVTNQTVVDMVNAKLPADLIVTKIQTSQL